MPSAPNAPGGFAAGRARLLYVFSFARLACKPNWAPPQQGALPRAATQFNINTWAAHAGLEAAVLHGMGVSGSGLSLSNGSAQSTGRRGAAWQARATINELCRECKERLAGFLSACANFAPELCVACAPSSRSPPPARAHEHPVQFDEMF